MSQDTQQTYVSQASAAAVYAYSYLWYRKERAERDALNSMGENKISYTVRDTLLCFMASW